VDESLPKIDDMSTYLIDSINGDKFDTNYTGFLSEAGNLLDLHHHHIFDIQALAKRPANMWRYREALPVANDEAIITFQEGFTPLLTVNLHGKKVFIKQEQLFTSGSYKDRGAAVLMSHVNELGIKKVIQDSSGNAGCAIAAYAAKANIDCDIFLQADTSPGKIAQMKMYGANIIKVNGSLEDAAAAAKAAAAANYYASHCYNPYFFHGTKTFAYEVCEQLNWQAPDAVVLPAGNGTLIIGCYIGFQDLLRAGYISNMPKLIAVQAANCAPLATAFTIGAISPAATTNTPTIAEGIAIAAPVRGAQMLHMVRETNGTFISVTEEEIKAAWIQCGKMGFYIEPTSAATIAGLIKYNEAYSDNTVVSLFSGHGLKSTEKVMKI